ncbi:MAG: hypothetical protein U5K76_11890 [Woeseiaceae bacterium]|nr:hypothetical protein [Woeseiaceae bacterium]
MPVKKEIEFANHENRCKRTEQEADRALLRAALHYPRVEQPANRQYPRLQQLDRRVFTGTERVVGVRVDLQLQAARRRDLDPGQDPGQERGAEEVQEIAREYHASRWPPPRRPRDRSL